MDTRRTNLTIKDEISADIICGTVSGTDPLSIRIDPTLTVTEPRLIVPKHVSGGDESVTLDGADETVFFRSKLILGTKVVMFRAVSGEKYLIVGIIGD